MKVQLLLFARLREICDSDALDLKLPAEATPHDCFEALAARYPELSSSRGRVLVAVNECYSDWQAPLEDGDRVAFIPPVSGG